MSAKGPGGYGGARLGKRVKFNYLAVVVVCAGNSLAKN